MIKEKREDTKPERAYAKIFRRPGEGLQIVALRCERHFRPHHSIQISATLLKAALISQSEFIGSEIGKRFAGKVSLGARVFRLPQFGQDIG